MQMLASLVSISRSCYWCPW